MRRGYAPAGVLVLLCGCGNSDSGSGTDTDPSGSTGATSTQGATTAVGTTGGSTSSDGSTSSGTTTDSGGSDTGTTSGGSTGGAVEPTVLFPKTGLDPDELGVLVNDNDPLSLQIADYYVAARGIPAANVVHLSFPKQAVMSEADFDVAKAEVDAMLPDSVQGLALTWTTPYRVDCMSVTAAFAAGFDLMYCNTTGMACGETAPVDTYDDGSTVAPYTDHGIRPAMMIAAETLDEATTLIDRGVASDGTMPFGDGYLVRTTDVPRSVRYLEFQLTVEQFDHMGGMNLQYIDNADGAGLNYIENVADVLFYFTGLTSIPEIATNTYLPGAVADHLTSFGGQVPTAGGQMSIIEWTRAGATASYGTVVEPCNYLSKFPNTSIMTANYFRGQTVLEAYWKSVWWPGEGLFIGEPLARPWDHNEVIWDGSTLTIKTTLLEPGVDYDVQAGDTDQGPWTSVFVGSVPYPLYLTIEIPDATAPYYRLLPVI
jgi:uncharacterized protein (TIGR03790 family)